MPYPNDQQYGQQQGQRYPQQQYGQYPQYPQQAQRQYAQQASQSYPQQGAQPAQASGQPAPNVAAVLDHRMIVPLVVIILLILGAGVTYFVFINPPLSAELEMPAVVENTEAVPEPAASPVDSYLPAVSADAVQYLDLLEKKENECESKVTPVGPGSRDECYLALSTDTHLTGYCVRLIEQSGELSSDACYLELAEFYRNSSFCSEMFQRSGNASKDECYFRIALDSGDVRFCDYIVSVQEPFSRAECFSHFRTTEAAYAAEYLKP
ncbi:hypothetical protein KY363_00405 [Candidatus Woesearchaeota archaeon]|nr:hypothetical protein [Candidatus Woesearchaeota archaeon]